jgi:sporulation protein YlmC with PRC-barrel domain
MSCRNTGRDLSQKVSAFHVTMQFRNMCGENEMLKKLMMTTAALALLTGSAFAQMSEQPRVQPSPSAATSGKAQFVTQQTADQLLATKFKGTNVMGPNDEKVGDVSDILFDKEGKVLAYVIGVGGFLGIGEKDVAIPFEDLRFTRDKDNDVTIEVDIDKSALTAAPDYQSLDDQAVLESAAKSSGGDKTHY